MTPCVGAKIVKAKPMDSFNFSKDVKGELPKDSGESSPETKRGYLVEYPDGYQGWNEKTEFERCSRKLTEEEYIHICGNMVVNLDGFDIYVTTKILGLEGRLNGASDGVEDAKDGYTVTYPNGHQSWTPKIKADEVYREINEDEFMIMNQGFEDNSHKSE